MLLPPSTTDAAQLFPWLLSAMMLFVIVIPALLAGNTAAPSCAKFPENVLFRTIVSWSWLYNAPPCT